MNDAITHPPPALQIVMLGNNGTQRQRYQRNRRAFILFQDLSWPPFVDCGLQDLVEVWAVGYAEDGREWEVLSGLFWI